MTDGFVFIIDFVNAKICDFDKILSFFKKNKIYFTLHGDKKGYDYIFFGGDNSDKYYLIDKTAGSYTNLCQINDIECINILESLQHDWRKILLNTITYGPDIDFLNKISDKVKYIILKTDHIYLPKIGQFKYFDRNFNDILEFSYLDIFIVGSGVFFKKLSECNNNECKQFYIKNRPKQKFCSDNCRHNFHNRIKIDSGYMAEHQRKGRREKPDIYMK